MMVGNSYLGERVFGHASIENGIGNLVTNDEHENNTQEL